MSRSLMMDGIAAMGWHTRGVQSERAAIVDYLRNMAGVQDDAGELADAIERGEHRAIAMPEAEGTRDG